MILCDCGASAPFPVKSHIPFLILMLLMPEHEHYE